MGNRSSRAATAEEKELAAILARKSCLREDMFDLRLVGHHGVPSNTKTMAYSSTQGILAIGTAHGAVKIYGRDGLEFFIEPPDQRLHVATGVLHMRFTAHQRLLVAYTDSSLRVFGLSQHGAVHAEVPETWTTNVITCVEAIKYANFPYVFVATDDGLVRVLHEDTGLFSNYTISPRDVGVTSTEETKHMQYVAAMAVCPRDPNGLLISYETSSSVFMWDLAKRKVVREFSCVFKRGDMRSVDDEVNSAQCLAWHGSGKRFVAGYKGGGISVFRADKSAGIYRLHGEDQSDLRLTPVQHIHWVCAPPNSRNANLPGAIVFVGGLSQTSSHKISVVYPPSGLSAEDALGEIVKTDNLTWQRIALDSINQAEITSLAVADDHADTCPYIAPFSMLVLSGNPLDGSQPELSVQPLPLFVQLLEGDKEEWVWHADRLPTPCSIPPVLQGSPVSAMKALNVQHGDLKLIDDLRTISNSEKGSRHLSSACQASDFAWPLTGGSVVEPFLKGFVSRSTGVEGERPHPHDCTVIITGHRNGQVMFWELIPPADADSKGVLNLLHTLKADFDGNASPDDLQISAIDFCPKSRILVLGYQSGKVSICGSEILDEGHQTSGNIKACHGDRLVFDEVKTDFQCLFSLHTHTCSISNVSVSTNHGWAAVADSSGSISLIHIPTQNEKLLVCDVSSEDAITIEKMVFCEVTQVLEMPSGPGDVSTPGTRKPSLESKSSLQRSCSTTEATNQQQVVVFVLLVGRGNGKVEMFHVEATTKIGDIILDAEGVHGVTELIVVDSTGSVVEVTGKGWTRQSDQAQGDAQEISSTSPDSSTIPSYEYTKNVIADVLQDLDADAIVVHDTDGVLQTTESSEVLSSNIVVNVPPGSLGLLLNSDIPDSAVVKAFVPESENGNLIQSKGVAEGHQIAPINCVNMKPYNLRVVRSVLEKLQERDKVIGFDIAKQETSPSGTLGGSHNNCDQEDTESSRFLICSCGSGIQVIKAAIPKASQLAQGQSHVVSQPVAEAKLRSQVKAMSVVRIPIEDHVENCLVVIDQSSRVQIMSVLTLEQIWESDFDRLGSIVDALRVDITESGEILIMNCFGELKRLTALSTPVAIERAFLQRKSVKSVLSDPARLPFIDGIKQPSSPKKKGIAEAGKMFRKLLSGQKDTVDLTKVFHFSQVGQERQLLFGDVNEERRQAPEQKPEAQQVKGALGDTKDTLMQTAQRLSERGDKLRDLSLKTEQMKNTSEDFYKTMKAFNEHNSKKKWYEL